MFELDSRLKADTVFVHRLKLCEVLLMNDANYPWVIMVPRRANTTEIYQLAMEDQCQLLRESSVMSKLLSGHFAAHKMNIAALGNVVSQLHIHQVVRFRGDVAWPAPVWGNVPAKPYGQDELNAMVESLRVLILSHERELNDGLKN